ncbi:MAG: Ig-like domain-containing protein [Clostridia bacterium]|nr:Ig-like domain-containing protein [Clostridia bacterium]
MKRISLKGISLVLAVLMMTFALPVTVGATADLPLTQVYNVNVSAGKPVYMHDGNSNTTTKLTDGAYSGASYVCGSTTDHSSQEYALPSGAKVNGSTGQADQWYLIDLGQRVKITDVKLWTRTDTTANTVHLSCFDILVSNTEDFADYQTIGSQGRLAEAWDVNTPFVAKGNGGYYRYVKVQKTIGTFHIFSELEVMADMTATEISRGKATTAMITAKDAENTTINTTEETELLTDGIVNTIGNRWYYYNGNWPEPYPYATVDLGEDMVVDYVQMWAGSGNTNAASVRFWEVYGRNATAGNGVLPVAEGATVGAYDTTTATKLGETTGTEATAKALMPLRSNNEEAYFQAATNGTKYRYLTFVKTGLEVWLSEVRALQFSPQVVGVAYGDGEITVSFSNKMDLASIKAANFTLSSGAVLTAPASLGTGWEDGFDVTFTYTGSINADDTLSIPAGVKDADGRETIAATMALGSFDASISITDSEGVAAETLVAGTTYTATAAIDAVAGMDADQKAMLCVAVKHAGETVPVLASCTTALISIEGVGTRTESITVTPESGDIIEVFLLEVGTLKPLTAHISKTVS